MAGNDDDEAENLSPRRVTNNYYQSKNGNGTSSGAITNLNNVLLACLLAIIGFLGLQIWNINDRLARVETNVSTLLLRP